MRRKLGDITEEQCTDNILGCIQSIIQRPLTLQEIQVLLPCPGIFEPA